LILLFARLEKQEAMTIELFLQEWEMKTEERAKARAAMVGFFTSVLQMYR
jgi:hypothetical protein